MVSLSGSMRLNDWCSTMGLFAHKDNLFGRRGGSQWGKRIGSSSSRDSVIHFCEGRAQILRSVLSLGKADTKRPLHRFSLRVRSMLTFKPYVPCNVPPEIPEGKALPEAERRWTEMTFHKIILICRQQQELKAETSVSTTRSAASLRMQSLPSPEAR